MALVSMRGIRLSFGGDLLLDDLDLNIEQGERACLVGRNGTGKSCLLKILHGDLAPDSGEIQKGSGVRIACLPQDVPQGISGKVEDIVASWLNSRGHSDSSWNPHHVVGKMVSHLHLDPNAQFSELSGGQKRRVLLARALACEPDLLLLDEPTNHLDIDSICWLEQFILQHCKTLLFVTHDRAFLRRVANRIIDLDRGHLAHWACDYDTFLARKADLLADEEVRNARFDEKLSKEEIWIRKGIKARRTRNEGRVRQLERMREERRARRTTEGTARVQVQNAERSGSKVIEAKSLSFSYDGASHIVKDFSTTIMRGDRIGVVGPNGAGKTTLLRLFTRELTPSSGEVVTGTKLEMAYFDQHRAVLDDDKTVAENIGRGNDSITINGRPRHIFSYLQDFLFTPDRAKTPVSVLSGGERNRLLLAMLFARPCNLLIMDEPTNDLDTATLELLEEQLLAFEGTVLMVSHDRAFLDNVVTRIMGMDGNGTVRDIIGGCSDYLRLMQSEKAAAAPAATKTASPKTKPARKFGFNEKNELKQLPARIEKLEAEQAALHGKMVSGSYYKTSPQEIAADKVRADALVTEIAQAYDRWEELESLQAG